VDWSERVCVYCQVLWVGPKHFVFCEVLCFGPNEFVCSVRCCGWVRRRLCVLKGFVGGSEGICVL